MIMSSSGYFKSQADAAAHYGVAERTMGVILREAGVKRCKAGISKARTAEAWKLHQQSKLRGDGSLRDEKLKREIDKLDIEIGKLRDELKPMSEWVAEVQELAGIVKVGMEQWVQWVAAEIKDPRLYEKAQDIRDTVLARLAERAKDVDTHNG